MFFPKKLFAIYRLKDFKVLYDLLIIDQGPKYAYFKTIPLLLFFCLFSCVGHTVHNAETYLLSNVLDDNVVGECPCGERA
jgi:hypothetical protein